MELTFKNLQDYTAYHYKKYNDIDLSAILEKDEKAAVKYGHDVNLKDFIEKNRNN